MAEDDAFCFTYRDNFQMLKDMGAELVPFSPIKDEKLPEGIDGLILSGGYPELHAKALSENASMRRAIHDAVAAGLPCIAECRRLSLPAPDSGGIRWRGLPHGRRHWGQSLPDG